MNLKKLTKKFVATVTAASLGISISLVTLPPPPAEAIDLGSVAGIIIGGTIQKQQVSEQLNALNNTEEGRQYLFNKYKEEYGVNDDPAVNARMDAIMANLTKAVGEVDKTIYDKPYLYFVSQDKSFNAFCSFGHVMTVNIGAINNLTTDDEIAAIIGHEMGHGQKDHTIKANKKRIDKAIMAGVASQAAGGTALTDIVASVVMKNSVAHGDRKQETEADNLAWEYIQHTNYNLGACAAVMQKMAELGGEKYNSTIFNPSDHPDTGKRRDNYANKLYEYSGKHASANNGVITINGKTFMTVAETSSMSSAERAFFVLGNIAAAYHNKHNSSEAYVQNGTVMLGAQPIITPAEGDEDAQTLADRLNAIK